MNDTGKTEVLLALDMIQDGLEKYVLDHTWVYLHPFIRAKVEKIAEHLDDVANEINRNTLN